MATTTGGTTYVTGTDLVASYPTASLALANRVDVVASGGPNSIKTASYTITLADILAGTKFLYNSASPGTFTLPTSGLVDGMTVNVAQIGAGALTVAGGTIVGTTVTNAQYQRLQFVYASTGTTWYSIVNPSRPAVVYGFSTTTATNNSTTTYADTNLTATITPSSATSRILVIVSQSYRTSGTTDANGSIKIVRGATDIWLPGQNFYIGGGASAGQTVDIRAAWTMTYLDSPATTSATVYKTQFNRNAGTVEMQPNSVRSSIVLMEVGA